MQHVDEGELHAWLDGALDQLGEGRAGQVREHLRTCALCREALVAEETLRARADDVLALAVPRSIDAPPFETLVERARAVQPVAAPARSRLSRVARMGWAASIVLALGAGWMAREIDVRPKTSDEMANVAGGVVPVAAVASDVGAGSTEVAAGPSVARTETQPSGEASVLSRAASGSRPVARRDAEPAPAVEKASPVPGQAASTRMTSASRALAEPRSEPTVEPIESASSPAPAAAAASRDARATAPSIPVVAERKPAAPVADADGSRSASTRPTVLVSRRPRPGENAAASAVRSSGVGLQSGRDSTDVPGLFARGRVGSAGTSKVAVTNDADIEEAVDLIVPDLPVLRVEWTEVSPGRPGLRVLQRLSPSDTLEVRFVRSGGAAADAIADPLAAVVGVSLRAGWSQVVRVHRDGWLVARAPVKAEELEVLVDRAGSKSK